MTRSADGLLCTVIANSTDETTTADAAKLTSMVKNMGVTFTSHPLTTAFPWGAAEVTRPRSILKMKDQRHQKRLMGRELSGLEVKIEKMERAGASDE